MHVLICNRSGSKGRFAVDLLSSFSTITVVGCFQQEDDIRDALASVPFDICVVGPSFLEKKHEIDPMAPGVGYPVRKYVMLSTNNTTERVIRAHEMGLHDVVDIGLHLATIDVRFARVLAGEVDLSRIASITEVVRWLRSDNIANLAQDETDIRILMELVEGRTNEEIAGQVHLALQTVRNRISRLMKAAGVSNRTQLATMLLR